MDVINYENAIKNMFNKNNNNSTENELNQNQNLDNKTTEHFHSKTSQLKSIKSLYSNDKKLKDNEINLLNSVDLTNLNEHEIDLENSIINSSNYKENNVDDDSEDEKLDIQSKLLINKLQNGIQTNKNGEIIINSNSDIHKTKNDNLNKKNENNNNNNKNNKLYLSNQNKNSSNTKIQLSKNNSNNIFSNKNNFKNKTIQNFSSNKFSSHKKKINFDEKKKLSTLNNKNLNTNPSSLTNKTIAKNFDSIENKFEAYNLDNLAYEAIKKYSKFKPKNFSFFERMKFYAIKQQTKNYMINMMINKSKTKIKETEKILTFNRLINDSNRRSEAKNRIELLNSNNKIANELYDTENLVMKTKKKKFDPIQFDKQYKENVVNFLKEKEHSLNLLRKQKELEQKEKEEKEINEMKKYHQKKVSMKQIEAISQRLYTEANLRKLKSNMNSNENSTIKNKINHLNNNKFKHKRYNSSKNSYYFNVNSKNNIFDNEYNINNFYNSSNENQTKKNKNKINKQTKKYIPYNNAEKMVDLFFENLNKN